MTRKLNIGEPTRIFDSYSSLDVPLVRKATVCGLMLIGGTAVQLLAKAYNVRERRSRSLNDLDFMTSYENKHVDNFVSFIKSLGFNEVVTSEFQNSYENKEDGVDVDILFSYESDVMSHAIKVRGVLVLDPCWQFVQKVQRLIEGFSNKRESDTQDLNTLFDIIVERNEIEKLQDLISSEVPDISEEELNSFLQE